MVEIIPGSESNGGAGAGEVPRETRYVSYILALSFMGFLDDKSQLCNLSKNDKSHLCDLSKIDKWSGNKVCGCPRAPIIYSLSLPQNTHTSCLSCIFTCQPWRLCMPMLPSETGHCYTVHVKEGSGIVNNARNSCKQAVELSLSALSLSDLKKAGSLQGLRKNLLVLNKVLHKCKTLDTR